MHARGKGEVDMWYADVDVAVADEYLGRFDEAVQQMEGVGLRVRRRLPAIGMVIGSIHTGGLASLAQLPEVSDVERAGSRGVPPPDRDAV